MKRFSILAFTLVLTAAMLTACRSKNNTDTSMTTEAVRPTTSAPTSRPTTAPTTRATTAPTTTQQSTSPEDTTIGPDGTVGTEGGNNSTDGGMDPTGSGSNGTDATAGMNGRARSGMRNATRSSRRF